MFYQPKTLKKKRKTQANRKENQFKCSCTCAKIVSVRRSFRRFPPLKSHFWTQVYTLTFYLLMSTNLMKIIFSAFTRIKTKYFWKRSTLKTLIRLTCSPRVFGFPQILLSKVNFHVNSSNNMVLLASTNLTNTGIFSSWRNKCENFKLGAYWMSDSYLQLQEKCFFYDLLGNHLFLGNQLTYEWRTAKCHATNTSILVTQRGLSRVLLA